MSYSSFDLNVILGIITSPNETFKHIRDNEEKYFPQSIGLFVVASFLSIFIMIPFVIMPLDEAYFDEVNDISIPADNFDIVLFLIQDIVTGFVFAILLYFIGKKLGGNSSWKKVFSVFFHTYVPAIPMTLIIGGLVFLMWSALTSIEPSFILSPEENEEQILSLLGPLLIYVGILALAAIFFLVWIVIISVKAIKILNGFSTGKTFGLFILIWILSFIVTSPLSM